MNIYCIDNNFQYELENIVRLFLPDEKIKIYKSIQSTPAPPYILAKYDRACRTVFVRVDFNFSPTEKMSPLLEGENDETAELKLAGLLFELLISQFNYRPKWGILTGVRPSKLMSNLINTYGENGAVDYFTEKLYVSQEKAELALEIAKSQRHITALSEPNSISLYVSIPFCPSRCSYCSFVSHSVTSPSLKKKIPVYVDLMCEEIRHTGRLINKLGLKLLSVYWGGGTPTALEAEALEKVFKVIEESCDLRDVKEYTVEAGRPDTVCKEKLSILKKHGATRISINPQTFNDEVLIAIGRNHTSEQTVNAYNLARVMGFDNINADLIAALPKDTQKSFEESVKKAIEMGFESITVHTLAKKRSSDLNANQSEITNTVKTTEKMLKTAQTLLRNAEYNPYYMYRQSKSAGNFENVGYSKEGKESLYNIFMMEEIHSVFAVGGGAVTKLKEPHGSYIERVYNFKYPYEYISRFRETLERKNRIPQFYETYCI
ncbi:MAG TPA: coproporphyrinogen dehydrogenase HemZ [Clostridia bacterium]|nr:coproporphyrinogen dehydrogenase HemZ [Clostridia bacterium]